MFIKIHTISVAFVLFLFVIGTVVATSIQPELIEEPVLYGEDWCGTQWTNLPEYQRTIHVQGNSEMQVSPDTAKVSLTVHTKGENANIVQEENSEKMDEFIRAIQTLGIDKEDIQTSNYRLYSWGEYDRLLQKHVDKGFRLTHTITVTIDDLDDVGDVLQTAVESGINQVGNVQFTLSDTTQKEITEKLLQNAGIDAHAKANSIASGLDVKIGQVISVVESGNMPMVWYDTNYRGMEMLGDVEMAAMSPPIAPQDQTMHVSLQVEFSIV